MICCDRSMHSHGADRWRCPVCLKTRSKSPRQYKYPLPVVLTDPDLDISTYPLSADSRGRIRIHLGKRHPLANRSGWQYLSRYVVETRIGYRLRSDEHVHHSKGILSDCRLAELEVWLAERHGRHHARTQLLYMFRDEKGRFRSSEVPAYSEQHSSELISDIDCGDFDLSSTSLSSIEIESNEVVPF